MTTDGASGRIGVYPGTFDPVTNGHLDIIARASAVLDHLIVAVATNPGKQPLFPVDQRVEMVRQEAARLALPNPMTIAVQPFANLLMDFVLASGARTIIRGLRAVSDFEYEFQMAGMNRRLEPRVETVFLMASDKYQLIASRFVKEIAWLGGDVSAFVPATVVERIRQRHGELRANGDTADAET